MIYFFFGVLVFQFEFNGVMVKIIFKLFKYVGMVYNFLIFWFGNGNNIELVMFDVEFDGEEFELEFDQFMCGNCVFQ